MRHTYTRSTATFICGGYATPDYLQVQYLYEYTTVRCPVQGTGTSRSGPELNVIKERLRRGYKAQLLRSISANGYMLSLH